MDAIDTSYQNIANLQENKTVETQDKKEDEFVIEGEVVSTEAQQLSFENLMDFIFDKVMEEREVEDKVLGGTINLPTADEVDEDVNYLVEFLSKENGKTNKKDEASQAINFLPQVQEQAIEDVPFVEMEIDSSHVKKEQIKENKNIIKDKKNVKIEEKKEQKVSDLKLKDDRLDIQSSTLTKQKNIEEQKSNIKREDIKKEEPLLEDGIEHFAQKTDKPKMKKLPITVQDLRTQQESNLTEAEFGSGQDASSEDFSSYYKGEILNDAKGAKEASANGDVQGTNKEGSFASILAQQIKDSSAEIVERGKILLRDGNVGEIRLHLKPEHLGSVRIELKLSGDKKMEGDVTVSSKDAYDAFEDSLGDLISAFKDAGFDTSGFNLNWKNRGNEEIVRDDLTDKYFSPEKTHQSLSEKLNLTENIYGFGQAENLNILA